MGPNAFVFGPVHKRNGMTVFHGDFGPWNILFNEGKKFTGVIDWDYSHLCTFEQGIAQMAIELIPLRIPNGHSTKLTAKLVSERTKLFCELCNVNREDLFSFALKQITLTMRRDLSLSTSIDEFASFVKNGGIKSLKNDYLYIKQSSNESLHRTIN